MDCSWLHEDAAIGTSDSGTDSADAQNELETRLYAIVHHNDLSQPLPPELAKHYSVQTADDGEVVVTLTNSLEEIKSQECDTISHILTNPESKNEVEPDDDVVVLDVAIKEPTNSFKRFRYSDVNLDQTNESQISSGIKLDNGSSYVNYFKVEPAFFRNNKNKKFRKLVLPPASNFLDWKTNANSSFISIGTDEYLGESGIVKDIVAALIKVNPQVNRAKLWDFALALYRKKKKAFKRKEKRNKSKLRKAFTNDNLNEPDSIVDLSNEMQQNFQNIERQDNFSNHENEITKTKNRLNEKLNGSISLNISPFRPDPQTVNLVSEDETSTPPNTKNTTQKKSRELSRSHIPTKWTKAMIKYYTKPSKKKLETDVSIIIDNLKRTTIAEDWWLDPRDRAGFYHRLPQSSNKARRCTNCHQQGHFYRECPSPKKILTCSLCGQYDHTDYSCPNNVCLKCGVFTSNQRAYGDECNACYYSTFDYDIPCELCGKLSHRTAICTDFWRSDHATTGGERKVPDEMIVNKRKCCCNCSRKGHFSHDCPFLMYNGQQTSPFVANYSAQPSEMGTAEMIISEQYVDIVNSPDADIFLQNLSNTTSAGIVFEREQDCVFRISGTFEQCKRVQAEIESYVNTKKRKRQEPMRARKKQKIR